MQKKKNCKSCGKPSFIFSKGRCKQCATIEDTKARVKKVNASVKASIRSLNQYSPNVEAVQKAGLKKPTEKQKWFTLIRGKLTGLCKCGCNQPSSKHQEKYYFHSCCHVFPQKTFESVQFHPDNFVERAFWGGCHSVMDDTGMNRWTSFADWEHIKEIFHELAPLLTEEERKTKFYHNFENLVYFGNIEGKK